MQAGVQSNSHGQSSCKEWQFWKDIKPSTIHYLQVYQRNRGGLVNDIQPSTLHHLQASWAYGPDFQLFQYSADTYLQQVRQKCHLLG